MLLLSRAPGERILIGTRILITVAKMNNSEVTIGVDAPEGVTILRQEIIGRPSSRSPSDGFCLLQPIETAPKDGRYLLLFGPSGYTTTPLRCEVGRWYPEYRPLNPWQTQSNDAFTDGGDGPTHWMELPQLEEQITNRNTMDKRCQ